MVNTDNAVFLAAAHASDETFARHAIACELDELVADYFATDAQVLPPDAPRVQGLGQIRELFRDMIDWTF